MPPAPRALRSLHSLVGDDVPAPLLLHFLRQHGSRVSEAADAYFAWREREPHALAPAGVVLESISPQIAPASPASNPSSTPSSPATQSTRAARRRPPPARPSAAAAAAAAAHSPLPSSALAAASVAAAASSPVPAAEQMRDEISQSAAAAAPSHEQPASKRQKRDHSSSSDVVGVVSPSTAASSPALSTAAMASPVPTAAMQSVTRGTPTATAAGSPLQSPVQMAAATAGVASPTTSVSIPSSPPPASSVLPSAAASPSRCSPATPRSLHPMRRLRPPLPLPLPLPVEEEDMDDADEAATKEGIDDSTHGMNLSAAFASAAQASGFTLSSASLTPPSRKVGFTPLLPGGGQSKQFKPPARMAQRGQSDSAHSSSPSPSTAASASSASSSSALSDSQRSGSGSGSTPSSSPPSQELVVQRVRNRQKNSTLEALISGLEADVARESQESVEPDLAAEAVNAAVGTGGQTSFSTARPTSHVPAASLISMALPSRPLIRFTSTTQLQQHLLRVLEERCCVPVTAATLTATLATEYADVSEADVRTQLDKLRQAGKVGWQRFEMGGQADGAAEAAEGKDARQVEVMWLQPMEIALNTEATTLSTHAVTAAAITSATLSPAPAPTPIPAPASVAAAVSPSTPLKPSPPASPAVSSLTTPVKSSASSAAAPASAPSSSNHLSKQPSSALKARLSRSRARPSLLTVGAQASTPAVDTPVKTPAAAGPVPWTEKAAAAAAAVAPPTPDGAKLAPSGLTEEQRAAIDAKRVAALSKRALHKPLLTPAASSASSPDLLSPTARLAAQLRVKQAAVAKLRDQKVLSIDPLHTAQTERLTDKWTVAAQEVLTVLLEKLQATRAVSMMSLLNDLQIEPQQVRWNEEAQDFE